RIRQGERRPRRRPLGAARGRSLRHPHAGRGALAEPRERRGDRALRGAPPGRRPPRGRAGLAASVDGPARRRYAGAMARPVALVCIGLALAGCGRRAASATPDGSVRELVERMHRLRGDPGDAKAAYELLSRRAQQNLAARALRYSAASGKAIAPEAMIVPSRFLVRFEPQRYVAQVSGSFARVEVLGLLAGERAQIACVFEDRGWRVDLG